MRSLPVLFRAAPVLLRVPAAAVVLAVPLGATLALQPSADSPATSGALVEALPDVSARLAALDQDLNTAVAAQMSVATAQRVAGEAAAAEAARLAAEAARVAEEQRLAAQAAQDAQAAQAARIAEEQAAAARASRAREAESAAADPRSIARAMLAQRGQESQFSCLDRLWTRESNWTVTATNRSSGAYGIPQSLPGSKMASAGADWRTNPRTQITWGLDYISARYGGPCGAWAQSQSANWY